MFELYALGVDKPKIECSHFVKDLWEVSRVSVCDRLGITRFSEYLRKHNVIKDQTFKVLIKKGKNHREELRAININVLDFSTSFTKF